MGLVQDLLKGDDAEAPVAPVSDAASTAPVETKTAAAVPATAESDARAAAAEAQKFASAIQGELEKRASDGQAGEAGELRKTLSKCAHYITELLGVKEAQEKYAESLLKEATDAAELRRYREAVKLAGELIAQGRIEAPDDYDIDKLAEELLKEDLRVVKKAAEFAGSSRLTSIGQAAEKTELQRFGDTSDDGRKTAGDRDFLEHHDFLLQRRA
jgi:hypothetical protein